MAIRVGACSVCASAVEAYLEKNKITVPFYTTTVGLNGKITFTVHINGDPRSAEYKSLFSMAWRKVHEFVFPYHQTKVEGNTLSCSNY